MPVVLRFGTTVFIGFLSAVLTPVPQNTQGTHLCQLRHQSMKNSSITPSTSKWRENSADIPKTITNSQSCLLTISDMAQYKTVSVTFLLPRNQATGVSTEADGHNSLLAVQWANFCLLLRDVLKMSPSLSQRPEKYLFAMGVSTLTKALCGCFCNWLGTNTSCTSAAEFTTTHHSLTPELRLLHKCSSTDSASGQPNSTQPWENKPSYELRPFQKLSVRHLQC